MSAVFVVGDVHGYLEKLVALLREAGLIDADRSWTGGDSALWLIGDLVDHGPDGIGVIELVMDAQRQASQAGGRVETLIGNHDVVLMAAHQFGNDRIPGKEQTFREQWEEDGGVHRDLERLTPEHVRWLGDRPALALVADHLLVHADALFYERYGRSLVEANQAIAALLDGDDSVRWTALIEDFGEHRAFVDAELGTARADAFMERFGGRRIVHGHTPIAKLTRKPPETVREPFPYCGARCLDVDPGMYLGGPGFIVGLPPTDRTLPP